MNTPKMGAWAFNNSPSGRFVSAKKNKTPQTIPPPKVNFHQVDKTYANLRFCAGAIVSLGGWTFLDG